MRKIPVIDIFAGPGGLNEGFSHYAGAAGRFDVKLSIEKDPNACETLRMRALFRHYREEGHVPELYYEAIRGDAFAIKRLKATKAWATAEQDVKQWTLGEVDPATLHKTIAERIGGSKEWVLLGGPPCQVYSIIGRASMKGPGSHHADDKTREKQRRALEDVFAADHRHTLYRQYLQIVAFHEPAIFVMENVKGILSAALPLGRKRGGGWRYEPVFERILADLRDPRGALSRDRRAAKILGKKRKKGSKYRLFSFVHSSAKSGECDDPSDFVIECEKFGVPQTRHRVIILGLREDVDVSAFQPLSESKRPITVRQTLGSLPKLRSCLSKDGATSDRYGEDSWGSWRQAVAHSIPADALKEVGPAVKSRIKQILKNEVIHESTGSSFESMKKEFPRGLPPELRDFLVDSRLRGFIQHEARAHMASDLGRYLYASVVAEIITSFARFLRPNVGQEL